MEVKSERAAEKAQKKKLKCELWWERERETKGEKREKKTDRT